MSSEFPRPPGVQSAEEKEAKKALDDLKGWWSKAKSQHVDPAIESVIKAATNAAANASMAIDDAKNAQRGNTTGDAVKAVESLRKICSALGTLEAETAGPTTAGRRRKRRSTKRIRH